MEDAQAAAGRGGAGHEHRSQVRYAVNGQATLLLLSRDQALACRIVDLSLNGCCIVSQQRIGASRGTRIEINFKVNGINFRFAGTIQWTNDRNQAGIRFPGGAPRQAEDLEIVLAEVEAKTRRNALAAQPAAAADQGSLAPQASQPAQPPDPAVAARPPETAAGWASAALRPSLSTKPELGFLKPESGRSVRDRRAQVRESVDSAAAICLVKSGLRFEGRIVDLSLGGCRIRVAERFGLGIYTRVEVEFRLNGWPFRLPGVTQVIRDQHTVGVRFIDVSERKQAQVIELIAEIRAAHQARPETHEDPGCGRHPE